MIDMLAALWSSVGVGTVLLVGIPLLFFVTGTVRYIPNTRVGIAERLWSFRGSVRSGLIALAGEAGFQPQVLRGGLHFMMPLQYRVHRVPLVTIPQGKIGYIFARDGQPLPPTQTLGSSPPGIDFQDATAFLTNGGQRGPQRAILREGTYAINLAQFVVITEEQVYYLALEREEHAVFDRMASLIRERDGFEPVVIKGSDDVIGIVTVHDGPSLPPGEIIAPTVGDDPTDRATFHNTFQDPERFLAAGGLRGRQLQVLVEGTYYVNRLFATVEMSPRPWSRSATSAWWSPTPARSDSTSRARSTSTASWSRAASAACGAGRSCRASTPSTPTPAR